MTQGTGILLVLLLSKFPYKVIGVQAVQERIWEHGMGY
jgi:hypothetical protein